LLSQTGEFGGHFEVRPMQGIVGVLAIFGLRYDQTTETKFEIEGLIDIFLLLEQDIFPNDSHVGRTVLNIGRDVSAAQEQKTHLAFWEVRYELTAFVGQFLAIKAELF